MGKLLSGLDEGTRKLVLLFIRILIVFAVIIIIFMIFAGCSQKGNNYNKLENLAESAAQNYYSSHKNELPTSNGESKKISISELVSSNYMKNPNSIVNDATCDGYVIVTKTSDSYMYLPNISCSEYKTNTLAKTIQKNIVADGDGVYAVDGGYFYKGNKLNNYVNIAGKTYRIISLDSNNNVKVIETPAEKDKTEWDLRYNTDKEDTVGINEYERSTIESFLEKKYNDTDPVLKKYILYSDWCTGKRGIEEDTLDAVECEQTTKGYFGTITIYDYFMASNDEKCDKAFSGACMNYNFISDYNTTTYWTMTGVKDNTTEAYYMLNGEIDYQKNIKTNKVLKAFNISGLNIISSGDGSEESPYNIK